MNQTEEYERWYKNNPLRQLWDKANKDIQKEEDGRVFKELAEKYNLLLSPPNVL